MLGIRLRPDEEERLERHARDVGRPKSALARDWIVERLDRESVDTMVARAASLIAAEERARPPRYGNSDSVLAALDAIDGAYDWGSEGPPA